MATYNCIDSSNNAYGSGNFGTCSSVSVGAPNTGFFEQVISGGSFTVIAPFIVAVVVVVIATVMMKIRKKAPKA